MPNVPETIEQQVLGPAGIVTASQLGAEAVVAGKIGSEAVTTGKVKKEAVIPSKTAAGNWSALTNLHVKVESGAGGQTAALREDLAANLRLRGFLKVKAGQEIKLLAGEEAVLARLPAAFAGKPESVVFSFVVSATGQVARIKIDTKTVVGEESNIILLGAVTLKEGDELYFDGIAWATV